MPVCHLKSNAHLFDKLGCAGICILPQPNVAQIQSGANQVKPLLVALKKAQATEEIGKNSKDVVNFSR